MLKRRIDAKQALEDIRSGMDDEVLKRKYGLSQRGLESLYKKLANVGAVRQLDPHEAVRDIREGMSESNMMEKYRLSPRGLLNLFDQLDKAGFVAFHEIKPRIERLQNGTHAVGSKPAAEARSEALAPYPGPAIESPQGQDEANHSHLEEVDDTIDLKDPTNVREQPAHASSISSEVDVAGIRQLFGLDKSKSKPEPVAPEKPLWECPVCLATRDEEFDVCPECGAFISDADEEEEDEPAPSADRRAPTDEGAKPRLRLSDEDGETLTDPIPQDEIVRDIRAGMTDEELIRKYRLTEQTLPLVFERLLQANAIQKREVDWRPVSYEDSY